MAAAGNKPKANLSLDLDNQWAYMKTHGDEGWQSFPSYFDMVVPRILELLERHNLTITFFIVGQDAALEKNHAALRSIAAAGHEIANHSFHHEPWLHLYTAEDVNTEIANAEDAIAAATGVRPTGFRGPGFSISETVLETLRARGYAYDASTFPTFLGPVARAYYFFNSSFSKEERDKRRSLYGTVSDGLRSLKPYEWQLANGATLMELPVTTMPVARVPFHLSYIMYLAGYSPAVARTYFKTALRLCRLRGIEPSLLLHPLDFLGGDDVPVLSYFPGMKLSGVDKVALADTLLAEYAASFEVLPMGAHARAVNERGALPRRAADFRHAVAAA
ncbi:polysaccharide deacetylase family protein [Hyphomicrobium sp. CS1GBMeth3]|uniref:polysaccharide deacetylase family protein n=1 Tax=Hyphomicrobium sp. CS1GBMeth3 TaxID=1892845 RepID=UPI000931F41D|nr:polysaccharide deacetylase family protein [Hyphomicrobium sp. CS1GBMeth3]